MGSGGGNSCRSRHGWRHCARVPFCAAPAAGFIDQEKLMAERVAVIGAGQMGNGIAHVFAQSGFDVTMIDVSADALERGRSVVAGTLERQIKKGTLQPSDKDAVLGRIATNQSLSSAQGASLVIEAATENRDLKFKIF